MSKDSPFLLNKVECPVCKKVNEFETVRVGAYLEKGRDTDFCPLEIEWRYPKYQAYDPLAFFAAMCPHCFYSREFTHSFRDWKKDANFKTYKLKQIKDKHLEQLAAADSIVKDLGTTVDMASYPNESAILKLHLAVFDEMLADHPSELDLGRFYLRIGWVFRSIDSDDDPGRRVIQGMLDKIDSRFMTVRSALATVKEESGILRRHLKAHLESPDLPPALRPVAEVQRDRFATPIDGFDAAIVVSTGEAEKISKMLNEYRQEATGGDAGASATSGFAGSPNFRTYLSDRQGRWDGIVVSEQQALQAAVHYYAAAFSNGNDIAPGYQQIQASYMIAELSRRVGDYDTARQYFNSTIKHGQEFIYKNRTNQSRTALARKILELAMEQGRENMAAIKKG
jgi:uncharacterized protein (DUF2225 family)